VAQARRSTKPSYSSLTIFVARQMKFDKTPGLTIGFIKDEFVWTKGYGVCRSRKQSAGET
jgi:hypothetical protein